MRNAHEEKEGAERGIDVGEKIDSQTGRGVTRTGLEEKMRENKGAGEVQPQQTQWEIWFLTWISHKVWINKAIFAVLLMVKYFGQLELKTSPSSVLTAFWPWHCSSWVAGWLDCLQCCCSSMSPSWPALFVSLHKKHKHRCKQMCLVLTLKNWQKNGGLQLQFVINTLCLSKHVMEMLVICRYEKKQKVNVNILISYQIYFESYVFDKMK